MTNKEFISDARKARKKILDKLNNDENSEFIVIAYNKKEKEWKKASCTTLSTAQDHLLILEHGLMGAIFSSKKFKPETLKTEDNDDSDSDSDGITALKGDIKDVMEAILKKIRD